ncbi:P-loop containing nucleoside triphosphate hydrolase protein [Powellomyces hirtus]|nr:P-loop containing nucleoside triphosphate hydrolase protein [Powellomyces hirtus]
MSGNTRRRSTRLSNTDSVPASPNKVSGPGTAPARPRRVRRPVFVESEEEEVVSVDSDGSEYKSENSIPQPRSRGRGKAGSSDVVEVLSDNASVSDEQEPIPPPSKRARQRPVSSDSESEDEPVTKKQRKLNTGRDVRPAAARVPKARQPTTGRGRTNRSVVSEPASPIESEQAHAPVDGIELLSSTLDLEHVGKAIGRLFRVADLSNFPLKPDHEARPLWVYGDGRIILEAFSPIAEHAQDFLIAVSEPITRPYRMHEYRLTEYSLYAAVSVGLETEGIIDVLSRLSKSALPQNVTDFIRENTARCGKVKLVLKHNRYWIESADEEVLRTLLRDKDIRESRVLTSNGEGDDEELIVERAPDAGGISFPGFKVTHAGSPVKVEAPAPTRAPSAVSRAPEDRAPTPEPVAGAGFFEEGDEPPDPEPENESLLADIDLFGLFDDFDVNEVEKNPMTDPSNPVGQKESSIPEGLSSPYQVSSSEKEPPPKEKEADFGSVITIDKNDEESEQPLVRSFEIAKANVDTVKKRCSELSYPTLEEYDFRQDVVNPNLNIDLKPSTQLRSYQEKSLSKMFGNGRARSGIIVLPCGAGKTLVGVTAACTIKKSCLVLCTSSVSVEQWAREFRSWSTVKEGQVAKFTQGEKEKFVGDAGIMISTYTMVAFSGKRAYDAQQMMDFITSREWGFLLLDEVHVVPAEMFRKVLTIAAAHAKLGLTATLVREDDKIGNLNYLIGPKLFEANWMDLARKGHIAQVQCAEVWCPMTTEFYREYLREKSRKRQLLFVMNPRKLQACQFLIDHHEQRGDKVIVFSDNVFALKHYAGKLGKPYIYGGTSPAERLRILQQFQYNPAINTVFLSKVGDTSIDLPEATCLIQISSHYGSRRQEAQRLGRILRAKKRNDSGFNAYFYSLVSKDTEEVYYAAKRQQFLIDQGYHFKIISKLEGMENLPDLVYATRGAQLELLNTVLVSTDMDDDEGDIGATFDDIVRTGGPRAHEGATVRQTSTLQSISGGDSMAYIEYSKSNIGQNKRRKGFFSRR